jgi:hypothetical protein
LNVRPAQSKVKYIIGYRGCCIVRDFDPDCRVPEKKVGNSGVPTVYGNQGPAAGKQCPGGFPALNDRNAGFQGYHFTVRTGLNQNGIGKWCPGVDRYDIAVVGKVYGRLNASIAGGCGRGTARGIGGVVDDELDICGGDRTWRGYPKEDECSEK